MEVQKKLHQRVKWEQDSKDLKMFYSPDFGKNDCWLRMNNFPEEPLWTLFWKGEELEIEDTPEKWDIKYNN